MEFNGCALLAIQHYRTVVSYVPNSLLAGANSISSDSNVSEQVNRRACGSAISY